MGHHSVPWMVRHAAQAINRYAVGQDGRTNYRRLKGKNYGALTAEFGESVWALRPKSKGITKFESRWDSGIWLGTREESGEHLIGCSQGVYKVRSIKRKAITEQRWNKEEFELMRGVPWRPVPGRG